MTNWYKQIKAKIALKPELIEEIKDLSHLESRLKELSLDGRAWSYSIMPFSHTTRFYASSSISKLPDWLIELSGGRVGYKGQIVGFSNAAQIREQNRGMGHD